VPNEHPEPERNKSALEIILDFVYSIFKLLLRDPIDKFFDLVELILHKLKWNLTRRQQVGLVLVILFLAYALATIETHPWQSLTALLVAAIFGYIILMKDKQ
jgi:hypothetical protein